ncbi:MAG: sigma-70 family RNA polymerase sigma factor [Gemmatimonadaceae bacterium]
MADAEHAKREKDRRFQEEALPWLNDVARFAMSLARDQADADDLVQETYLRAYRSWNTFIPGSDCRRWLFTICRNVFLRTREVEHRSVALDDPELESLAAAQLHAQALADERAEQLASVDLWTGIDKALGALPEPFRSAVILVDIHDQSYDDAASILGVPIGTVRSRLFRGRRLLQESLMMYARDAGLAPSARDSTGRERR